MPSINRVTLAGHLGKDPESKSFANGGSVCNFSIATSESWTDKSTGEKKERTDWHNIVCNGKTGEIAQKYLAKGAAVLIEGSIRQRSYEKDGQTRYVTEIMCDRLHFLGKGDKNTTPTKTPDGQVAHVPIGGGGFVDDNIPFAPRSWKEG